MSVEPTTSDAPLEMSLEEILTELDQSQSNKLPVPAIRAAQARRDEIIPHLIGILQKPTLATFEEDDEAFDGNGPFFALFLLGEFRAKEALPVLLEVISLSRDLCDRVFGDALTSVLSRILAVLADDRLDLIDECVQNEAIGEIRRWTVAETLGYLVRDGKLSRDEAVARLKTYLVRAMENEESILIGGLVSELVMFSPHEAKDEIERAFREEMFDPFLVSEKEFRRSLAPGGEWSQEEMRRALPSGIDDTVAELEKWAGFQESDLDEDDDDWSDDDDYDPFDDAFENVVSIRNPSWVDDEPIESFGTIRNTEPRIGRNEPCPCGSGKKYKKCCLKP